MILVSIKPYYYYLIAEEKKKIEVRKMALKNLPQDIVFYMSKDEKSFAKIPKEFQEKYRKHFGKIGMRVVCDKVYEYTFSHHEAEYRVTHVEQKTMCLNQPELIRYGKGKTLYGWHISQLKIYDKPKELREFSHICSYKNDDGSCQCRKVDCLYQQRDYNTDGSVNLVTCGKSITRPPQSYMYVEEV